MIDTYEKLIQGLLDKGFGTVDNWLSAESLIDLRKSLLKHYEKDNFHLAGIGNRDNLQTLEKVRNDHIYWLDFLLANEVELLFKQQIDDFVNYLNRTCFAGIHNYEFHYAVYDQGSFYKKHIDRFNNDDKRRFSMVFYLSDEWLEGDGGELLLYQNQEVYTIKPKPGTMVFFCSDIPHEVLPSFKRRLSLTGWMKSL